MKTITNTWFSEHLSSQNIEAKQLHNHYPTHMPCFEINIADWKNTVKISKQLDMRFVSIWATETKNHSKGGDDATLLFVYLALAHTEHRHTLIRTELSETKPEISSVSKYYISAYRMERNMQDMFGIHVKNIPDHRQWIKHEHWPEDTHVLRSTFDGKKPLKSNPNRTNIDYAYIPCDSEHAYEIPVGPVHAGIIEPGHFRFLAVGEMILNMEERLGYVHKGIEKSMFGRQAHDGLKLAARISGDSTVGHAWAFAQTCEYAANTEVPERAQFLRGVLCERERIANHIGDIGAICNDAGFAFMHVQCSRLREDIARLHKTAFGHRLLMDTLTLGGISNDITEENRLALIKQTKDIASEVERLRDIYADTASIQQRVIGAGIVSIDEAKDLGLLGFVGRSSGHYPDARIDEAYPPYHQLHVEVPKGKLGGVSTRVWARFEEIANSSRIIIYWLGNLPQGLIQNDWTPPSESTSGFAAIESWRGEIAAWICFGDNGNIDRYAVRDPSSINWLGLELAVRTVPVPDFPLVNKSFNCSYAGHDL